MNIPKKYAIYDREDNLIGHTWTNKIVPDSNRYVTINWVKRCFVVHLIKFGMFSGDVKMVLID